MCHLAVWGFIKHQHRPGRVWDARLLMSSLSSVNWKRLYLKWQCNDGMVAGKGGGRTGVTNHRSEGLRWKLKQQWVERRWRFTELMKVFFIYIRVKPSYPGPPLHHRTFMLEIISINNTLDLIPGCQHVISLKTSAFYYFLNWFNHLLFLKMNNTCGHLWKLYIYDQFSWKYTLYLSKHKYFFCKMMWYFDDIHVCNALLCPQ